MQYDRLADPRIPYPATGRLTGCSSNPSWFSHATSSDAPEEVTLAKRACASCPVARQCLLWALANPALTPLGIWAATTPKERVALRTRLRQRLGPDWVATVIQRERRRDRMPSAARLTPLRATRHPRPEHASTP